MIVLGAGGGAPAPRACNVSVQGDQALGQEADFGCKTPEDVAGELSAGPGSKVLDGGPVLGDQLETVLGPVDGVFPVGEELFGTLVCLAPCDVAAFDELGQGRGGVAVREAQGVGIDHVLPEPFRLQPLVECRCGVVEGEKALGDLCGKVGGVLTKAVVLGLECDSPVSLLAGGGVGGVEGRVCRRGLVRPGEGRA